MITRPRPRPPRQHNYRRLLRRYERYAPKYDRRFARYSAGTLGKTLEMIPSDARGSLIDVACGTGLFEESLRQHRPALQLTGIDISPDMIEQARQRLDGQVAWHVGHAERLPVESASFDYLTCNNAFHLVRDGAAALREFRRVLKPGGMLIIVDWCLDFPQMLAMDLLQRLTEPNERHVRRLDDLIGMLAQAGFTIKHRERFTVPPLWGLMCVAALKSER